MFSYSRRKRQVRQCGCAVAKGTASNAARVKSATNAQASPPFSLAQKDVEQVARDLFSDRFPQFERMAPVFTAAGVQTRQVVRPIEWRLQPRGWPELAAQAKVPLAKAEAIAIKARPGRVTDKELEKEAGGSGLR